MCESCRKVECRKELALRWLHNRSDALLGLKMDELPIPNTGANHGELLVEK
jgi:hypothetical protein